MSAPYPVPIGPQNKPAVKATSQNALDPFTLGYYGNNNSSVGINIPQTILAGLEAYVIHGNVKTALIYGGAVGLSNLVGSGVDRMIKSDVTEKYLAEPIIAGALADLAFMVMDKKHNYARIFGEGFLYGSSSAVVSNAFYNTIYSPVLTIDKNVTVFNPDNYAWTQGSYMLNRSSYEKNSPDSEFTGRLFLS